MASWGLLVNGPTGHHFYRALDRLIRGEHARAIALKIAVDQLVYTPPLTAGFFAYMSLTSGSSAAEALEAVQRELRPVLIANWSFWSVAHVITFAAVPLEHRVAWVAAKNFVWSGFLSWRLSKIGPPREESGGAPPELPVTAEASSNVQARAGQHTGQLLRRYSTREARDDG